MALVLSLPRSPLPSRVREGPRVYRPRRPERTALYRLFDLHFDAYLRAHEERFEPKEGPLRPVVRESVEAFLECGRLTGGFARVRCPRCAGEHLLAFSCRTRNFCPSCQAKRAALLAEHLEGVFARVPHRHWVFTIPKALRGLFARERSLLALLPRCAFAAVRRLLRERAGRRDGALDPDPLLREAVQHRRVAWCVRSEGKWRVLLDGTAGPAFDRLLPLSLSFSADGKRFGYAGMRDGKFVRWIDGAETRVFTGPVTPVLGAAGAPAVWVVVEDEKGILGVGDREMPLPGGLLDVPAFVSPDVVRILLVRDGKLFVVVHAALRAP